MPPGEAAQQAALLLLWALALGLDVGGLLRHLVRLHRRQRILHNPRIAADPELRPEARRHRNNEVFRSEIKAGLAAWAGLIVCQRWLMDAEAPVNWAAWGLWGAHMYLVLVLYVWTERDR